MPRVVNVTHTNRGQMRLGTFRYLACLIVMALVAEEREASKQYCKLSSANDSRDYSHGFVVLGVNLGPNLCILSIPISRLHILRYL